MVLSSEQSWLEKKMFRLQKVFQVQAFQTELKATISTMPGIESSF